jgi:hypothetical protein
VDAVEFARAHHEHDVRKGTSIPYLSHLLAVASITLDHGGSEDQAIAALLHDVAEDRGGQSALDAIAQRFGPEVARIVAACSDTVVEPKPPWPHGSDTLAPHDCFGHRTVAPTLRPVRDRSRRQRECRKRRKGALSYPVRQRNRG